MRCAICGNDEANKHHQAREMMLGTREKFTYSECADCGTLQLVDPPADLSRFYPTGYYSLQPFQYTSDSKLKRFVRTVRTEAFLRGFGIRPTSDWAIWFEGIELQRGASICDIGTGNGALLFELARNGFTDLVGADPYLPEEGSYGHVRLVRATISELDGAFDLIMLHHTFEHLERPHDVMGQVRRLLRPGGRALIRIPLADSWTWRTFGTDWVHLDPPRHLFLYTRDSMARLAHAAGLAVERFFPDSGAYSIWVSEQYRRGIAMNDEESALKYPELLRSADFARCAARAAEMNAGGDADSGGFILKVR